MSSNKQLQKEALYFLQEHVKEVSKGNFIGLYYNYELPMELWGEIVNILLSPDINYKPEDLLVGLDIVPYKYFYQVENLTELKIPGTIKGLALSAICECPNLESVAFGQGIQTISRPTISNCNNLKYVAFPPGIKTVQDLSSSAIIEGRANEPTLYICCDSGIYTEWCRAGHFEYIIDPHNKHDIIYYDVN